MRGDRIHDRVDVVEIGPGGLVVRNAPYIARGEHVELVFELGDQSFRFRAEGVWLKDDGDDYKVGLAFLGMPVCLNKATISAHQADVVDRIARLATSNRRPNRCSVRGGSVSPRQRIARATTSALSCSLSCGRSANRREPTESILSRIRIPPCHVIASSTARSAPTISTSGRGRMNSARVRATS